MYLGCDNTSWTENMHLDFTNLYFMRMYFHHDYPEFVITTDISNWNSIAPNILVHNLFNINILSDMMDIIGVHKVVILGKIEVGIKQ